jgi:hypothetical protein
LRLAVAEYVDGWTWVGGKRILQKNAFVGAQYIGDKLFTYSNLPNYHNDIAAAWSVRDVVFSDWKYFEMWQAPNGVYRVNFTANTSDYAFSKNPAEAICRAALIAKFAEQHAPKAVEYEQHSDILSVTPSENGVYELTDDGHLKRVSDGNP